MRHRLAIGTAQFGSSYGIANRTGQVTCAEAAAILDRAWNAGVRTLDTAIAYGDSEGRLGEIGVAGWQVVSKLPGPPDSCPDTDAWVRTMVTGSLARLAVPTLHGLLIHRSEALLGPRADALWSALARVKLEGLVRAVGVSIYAPEELDALAERYPLDIVQAPLSVLDRRLHTSGWLRRLDELGVEVHARSVFLQGLLVMAPARRPRQFDRWRPLFCAWDRWLDETKLSRARACLGYALSYPEIDRVVVGVDSADQLLELLAAAEPIAMSPPAELSSKDVALINPARWESP